MLWFPDEILGWLRSQPVAARPVELAGPDEGFADLAEVRDGRRASRGTAAAADRLSFADLPDAVRQGARA